jgi:tetratricopeptide (TPR) repeat protein
LPRPPRQKDIPKANRQTTRWWIFALAGAAVFLAFLVYAPALNGPYVFDDFDLPYHLPEVSSGLQFWISAARPLLLLSYGVNYQFSREPFGFHVTNVAFHLISSFLVFFIMRKLLDQAEPGLSASPPESASVANLLAAFGAAVFLLHPIQTESVAYIAGRSECLSVLFFFAAFTVFLYRRQAEASWRIAIAVMALFGAALGTKEHTLVLPGLLLLTDYYWNPGFSSRGIRRNWRIYAPLAVGSLAGVGFVAWVLAHSRTAGFGATDIHWYQYFLTECRAFFVYLRLLAFPAGQNLDWDFPVTRKLSDYGAFLALAAILLLAGAAIYFRRRYPLASYGFLVYLLLLLPTSSFVPIKDPVAERRLYLPMMGMLLVMAAVLRCMRIGRRRLAVGCAVVAAALAVMTYRRNLLWASDIGLWEDTARKSPAKARAHYQLAFTYYRYGRCRDAVAEYAETARLEKPDHHLLLDWGLACECAGQPAEALAKLREAAALRPSAHVYSQIGLVYARQSQWPEALAALAQAEKLDSGFAMTYYYRGGVRAATGDFAAAAAEYQRALARDPTNQFARLGLAYAQHQLSPRR